MKVKDLIKELKKFPDNSEVAGVRRIAQVQRAATGTLTEDDYYWNEANERYEVRPYLVIEN